MDEIQKLQNENERLRAEIDGYKKYLEKLESTMVEIDNDRVSWRRVANKLMGEEIKTNYEETKENV